MMVGWENRREEAHSTSPAEPANIYYIIFRPRDQQLYKLLGQEFDWDDNLLAIQRRM